jgi:hypothetical protein
MILYIEVIVITAVGAWKGGARGKWVRDSNVFDKRAAQISEPPKNLNLLYYLDDKIATIHLIN